MLSPVRVLKRGTARVYRELRLVTWWAKWGRKPFSSYQAEQMDAKARVDARAAVGGLWDEMGEFQLRLLHRRGLRPEHRLLDVGAGSLRGGVHLARYLGTGNYWGTDISPVLLDSGRRHLAEAGLSEKRPTLLRVRDFTFRELEGQVFDYILAFGVFTDVPQPSVEECFRNLGKLMTPQSEFLATFALSDRYVSDPLRLRFRYPWSIFEQCASETGFAIELVRDITHPKGHSLLIARRQA